MIGALVVLFLITLPLFTSTPVGDFRANRTGKTIFDTVLREDNAKLATTTLTKSYLMPIIDDELLLEFLREFHYQEDKS